MKPDLTTPEARATYLVQSLQDAGFDALWAGGCVRDFLIGRDPNDYDIATSARPDEVLSLFPGSVAVGKAFGVVRVPVSDEYFEVATFREDHDYKDGRRPAHVSFTDAQTDARRRDFTVNAIFYDPVAEEVHDFVDGRKDLDARLIRCVGDPAARLREDHLRVLRAVRFAATLGFEIEPATRDALRASAHLLSVISAERVRDELIGILLNPEKPGDAIRMLDSLGILEVVLPEVAALAGVEQPPQYHPEGDVLTHTVNMLNAARTDDIVLAAAALLHDIGKPQTFRIRDGRIRFFNHAEAGARIAKEILSRLHFPKRDIHAICHCIANHTRFMQAMEMNPETRRKLVGAPTFPIELELHRLDRLCASGDMETYDFLKDFVASLDNGPALPDPWVSGNDILGLGLARGPAVGAWHRRAYDEQLSGRHGDRDALLRWLQQELQTETDSA